MVVGASAGGVEALIELLRDLPEDLGAAVLIVLHMPPVESRLPEVLARRSTLPVRYAADGERLMENVVYIAPPDRHLLVWPGRLRVARGPSENLHRPAVDPLFRSAALSYGERVVAVVLSGSRDDGAAGAAAVARHGGRLIVQDPETAAFPSMPAEAIAADHPDVVLPLPGIPAAVAREVHEARGTPRKEETMKDEELEREFAAFELTAVQSGDVPGRPSKFGCPSCGGVLWKTDDAGRFRYRCRVGHAFGPDSLLAAQSESLETALWSALRALEERASLSRSLAKRHRERGSEASARHYERAVEESERNGQQIRDVLLGREPDPSANE